MTRELPVITDPRQVQINSSLINRFWLSLIRDERDLPFVHLLARITLVIIPLGVLLYLPFVSGWVWWAVAIFYLYFNNMVFKGPFGLMTHCISHRKLFKREVDWLNHYSNWLIGPFFGQSPNSYFTHHVGMHHPENNLEDDDSSTMLFQRDSFTSFLRYEAKFLFLGFYNVTRYFRTHDRPKLRHMLVIGEMGLFAFWALMCLVNWQATLVVFILPFFISRLIMMLGNWTQHAFVDFDEPENFFKNSVTCVNTKYNHKCWNDGYHTSHHLKPNLHWTALPDHLEQNLDEFAENRALVFQDIHYLHLWWWLMTKNYDKMVDHLININGMFSSREEAIELLKSRTKRMPRRGITSTSLRARAQAA